MDYISLGPTQAEEDCAWVGAPGYYTKAHRECTRYVHLLRQKFGPEPERARLEIKGNLHDFATYYDDVVWYDENDKDAIEYALRVEREAPTRWDE